MLSLRSLDYSFLKMHLVLFYTVVKQKNYCSRWLKILGIMLFIIKCKTCKLYFVTESV